MDSRQITSILQSDPETGKVFRGVFPLDYIEACHRPGIYICNTDPSHLPGEHWIVIGLSEHNTAEYFDSFGQPPQHTQFKNFLLQNAYDWTFNNKCIQHPFSVVCGQYCSLFALHYARGLPMSQFTGMFYKTPIENDTLVYDYALAHFNRHMQLIDADIVVNQVG